MKRSRGFAVLVVVAAACWPLAAEAQTPNIDLEAVHNAFWQMGGQTSIEALQWFEQEVNKYYYGDDYVSVAAERVDQDGYPATVVTGYIDRDGIQGFDPDAGDSLLFRFAQTGPIQGYSVPYEFLDSWGNVYYRGARVIPRSPFYLSYYYNWRTPIRFYYTPRARLAYLRTWRLGWRTSPVYFGWRRRFVGWRAGYRVRIGRLRTTYGLRRARIGIRGFRGGVRVGVRGVRVGVGVRGARVGVGVRGARVGVGVRGARIGVGVRGARIGVGVRGARVGVGVRGGARVGVGVRAGARVGVGVRGGARVSVRGRGGRTRVTVRSGGRGGARTTVKVRGGGRGSVKVNVRAGGRGGARGGRRRR